MKKLYFKLAQFMCILSIIIISLFIFFPAPFQLGSFPEKANREGWFTIIMLFNIFSYAAIFSALHQIKEMSD